MSKNIILFKMILNQKSLIPFIIVISLLMSFIHYKITILWLVLILWAVLISGFILYLKNKDLIVKEFKIRTIIEGTILLTFLYFLAIVPSNWLVLFGTIFSLFYLVVSLTEKKSKSAPLVKSINSYKKISDEERLGFNSRQKLNYTLPNSEVELAIIDGEVKLAELIDKQKKLTETIATKESEMSKLESELKDSKNYQYVKKLRQALRQVLSERDALVKEKEHIQKEKEDIITELHISKQNLETQTKANNALYNEKQDLLERLKENEKELNQKQYEKEKLLKERDKFNTLLQSNKKEIEKLRIKKGELENLEIQNADLSNELEKNKENILNITKELEENISLRKKSEEELSIIERNHNDLITEYENIKLQTKNELDKYQIQYKGLEEEHFQLKVRLGQAESDRINFQRQLSNNIEMADQLNQELTKTKRLSKERETELKNNLSNLLSEQEYFEKILEEKTSFESNLKIEIEQKNIDYSEMKRKYNNFKNDTDKQLTKLLSEKEKFSKIERELKERIRKYEEIQKETENLKSNLSKQNGEFKKQIDSKNQEIQHYKNEIRNKQKAQVELNTLIKQNEDKIAEQEKYISQLRTMNDNDKEEIQQKEQKLMKQQKIIRQKREDLTLLEMNMKAKEVEIEDLEEKLKNKQEKLDEVESNVDKKGLEVLEREEEIENLRVEMGNLIKENENQKENIKYFYTDQNRSLYEQELLRDEQILDEETVRNSSPVKRRFKVIYPNLDFAERFFADFKKLDDNDKIQLEKQILYLCYAKEKVQYRPKPPKGLREIRFKRDQNGPGKGRIYITKDKKKVLGLSISDHEQKRKISQI